MTTKDIEEDFEAGEGEEFDSYPILPIAEIG